MHHRRPISVGNFSARNYFSRDDQPLDLVLGIGFGWIHGLDYTLTFISISTGSLHLPFCTQLHQSYSELISELILALGSMC